jgi:hypothetical protein
MASPCFWFLIAAFIFNAGGNSNCRHEFIQQSPRQMIYQSVIPGIMPLTEAGGRDSALRCPRRRAQRQAAEKRSVYHVRSVLPDGDAAARRPYHPKSLSKA